MLVDGAVQITNLSRSHPTRVNDKPVNGKAILRHKDMIAIADRHFRFEYPDNHPLAVDGKFIPMVSKACSVLNGSSF